MKNIWCISDTHFGDGKILTFKETDGSPVRDFQSVTEMDEYMITMWNECIKPGDRVYHLGDVCMRRESLKLLKQLHGKKVLVKGNHDIFKLSDYDKYFEDIRAYIVNRDLGLIFSHVPLHTSQMHPEKSAVNVHGHTHSSDVTLFRTDITPNGMRRDPRYLNICVEKTGYAPIHLDEVLKRCGRTQAGKAA